MNLKIQCEEEITTVILLLETCRVVDIRKCILELETDGVADEALAAHVVEYARNNGMLMGRTGRNRNVLKLRPPMPFSAENASLATEILNRAFQNAKT